MSKTEAQADFDVRYVARLARIDLTDEEVAHFQAQLAEVVGYVRQLEGLDLEGVEPMTRAVGSSNVFRKDERRESLPQADVLANAPAERDGLIAVPRILE